MIKASDTDILVIALSIFPSPQDLGVQQLWVAVGHDVSLRWIGVHDLYHVIGLIKTKGILFFHAFTGCDTVSAFHNKGKKTAWQTWDIFPEASLIFSKLSQYPPVLTDSDLEILELCFNTLNVLYIRQAAYWVKQPSVSRKQRVLLTGDGKSLVNNGRSSGQQMHQLHKVVNN